MSDSSGENQASEVVEDLEMYQKDNLPIELIFDSHSGQDSCGGFVITVGEDYVLIARLWQYSWLNGFRAVRLTKIQEVLPLGSVDERFVCRAMQARGETIPPKLPINPATMAELVKSVCQFYPIVLFGIRPPKTKPYDLGGTVQHVQEGVVTLRSISKEGDWMPEKQEFQIRDICELFFGSQYEITLDLISQLPDAGDVVS